MDDVEQGMKEERTVREVSPISLDSDFRPTKKELKKRDDALKEEITIGSDSSKDSATNSSTTNSSSDSDSSTDHDDDKTVPITYEVSAKLAKQMEKKRNRLVGKLVKALKRGRQNDERDIKPGDGNGLNVSLEEDIEASETEKRSYDYSMTLTLNQMNERETKITAELSRTEKLLNEHETKKVKNSNEGGGLRLTVRLLKAKLNGIQKAKEDSQPRPPKREPPRTPKKRMTEAKAKLKETLAKSAERRVTRSQTRANSNVSDNEYRGKTFSLNPFEISIRVNQAIRNRYANDNENTLIQSIMNTAAHDKSICQINVFVFIETNTACYLAHSHKQLKVSQCALKDSSDIQIEFITETITTRSCQNIKRPCTFQSQFAEREPPIDLTGDCGMNTKEEQNIKNEVIFATKYDGSFDLLNFVMTYDLLDNSIGRTDGNRRGRVLSRNNIRLRQDRVRRLQFNCSEETLYKNVTLDSIHLINFMSTLVFLSCNQSNYSRKLEKLYFHLFIQCKTIVIFSMIRSVKVVTNANTKPKPTPEATIMTSMAGPLTPTPTYEARTPSHTAEHKNIDGWSCKILTYRLS